ncbi:uncharacterized protein LOC107646491 [Arachis ipaensis]|uniref:uncharacterized protein LOC107646491 n=1 Tax=Arachis ipaensis TaxID=130454 RepID=UPI0007AFCDCC|nr:uncharacterized protein LOC107646491 [Arachis ipaensis]
MAIIPGGGKLYLSLDSICMDEGIMESQLDLYGPKLLNSINCSGLPSHKLILKVGVPVMLLRNFDQFSGLCNGTRLQVRKLENHVIECEVLTGNNVGHITLIPRMNMVSLTFLGKEMSSVEILAQWVDVTVLGEEPLVDTDFITDLRTRHRLCTSDEDEPKDGEEEFQ